MKRRTISWILVGLSIGLFCGCGSKDSAAPGTETKDDTSTRQESTESETDQNGEITSSVSPDQMLQEIQKRYAGEDTYEYKDPMYNVEQDHVFSFSTGNDFQEKMSEWADAGEQPIRVFWDNKLENEVQIDWAYDEDAMEYTVSSDPLWAFNYDRDREVDENWNDSEKVDEVYEKYNEGHSWGSRSKFWLVQYYNMETGEKLEKPLVTVFSIAKEITTPTLKQEVGENGYYSLSWTGVEGADYYEVYKLDYMAEQANLEYTTENTFCTVNDFQSEQMFLDEEEKETYDGKVTTMNMCLPEDEGDSYFVVAKSKSGASSGMSNECKPFDIANQIPKYMDTTFQTDYEGDSVSKLPSHANVEMLDGSIAKFLLDYKAAQSQEYFGDSVLVNVPFQSLDIVTYDLILDGVSQADYEDQKDELIKRQEDLETKSVRSQEDIEIPFVPESPKDDKDKNEEGKEQEGGESRDSEEPESSQEGENSAPETSAFNLADNVAETLYANTALSEWIAWNLLAHEESISLDGFPQAADSEYLADAFLEAYNQNPLCGILDVIFYDYETNCLMVDYIQDAEETEKMQQDSLKKAKEIKDAVVKDGMSDYEKELAINEYICENVSYNDEIMDHIDADGSIDREAVEKFANSFTPYGALVENLGVCESYAEAFQLIAREAGLDVIIVTGKLDGVNHEWNRVKLEDNWYTLDVTNNDNDVVKNALFNLSDETAGEILLQDSDAIKDEYVGNYTADNMDFEYYTMSGLYTEDAKEATGKLSEALKKDGRAAVRMNGAMGGESLEGIIQESVDQSGVAGARYYQFANVIVVIEYLTKLSKI